MNAIDTTGRHPATAAIAKWFDDAHLPADVASISQECAETARSMIAALPDGPELTAG